MTYLNHHRDGRRERERGDDRSESTPWRTERERVYGGPAKRSGRPRETTRWSTGTTRAGAEAVTEYIPLPLYRSTFAIRARVATHVGCCLRGPLYRCCCCWLAEPRITIRDSDTLRYEQLRNPRVSRRIDRNPVVTRASSVIFFLLSLSISPSFSFLLFSFEFSILFLSVPFSLSLHCREERKERWTKP